MTEVNRGVGLNGEPDDFGARYDRMVTGGGTGWVIKIVLALGVLLALVGVVVRALGL